MTVVQLANLSCFCQNRRFCTRFDERTDRASCRDARTHLIRVLLLAQTENGRKEIILELEIWVKVHFHGGNLFILLNKYEYRWKLTLNRKLLGMFSLFIINAIFE